MYNVDIFIIFCKILIVIGEKHKIGNKKNLKNCNIQLFLSC